MKKMFNKAFIAATVLSCLSAPAFAEYDINVPDNNNPMYHYEVLQNGEVSFYGKQTTSNFTIKELETIINGTGVWADVIKYSSGPALIGLGRLNEGGAYAQSEQVEVFTDASQKVKKEYLYPAVYAALNNEYYEMSKNQDEESKRSKKVYSANIMIGNANSSSVGLDYSDHNENAALYQQKADSLRFTIQHEIGHTLGVSSEALKYEEDTNPDMYQFSSAEYDDDGKILPATSGKITIFDKYLRVYDSELKKEVSAGRGMIINANPETSKSDYGVNEDYVFDLAKGSPYFVGPKTMQVLAGVTDDELSGKTEDEIIKYCQDKIIAKGGLVNYSSAYDGTNRPKVYGLPIHPYDYNTIKVDLSHTELRNSMMSHQTFSNWATFMEAELAVLKDIGYNINLSEYFGKSYYLDDITDTVKLNNDTFTKDFAIGVHVYGNRDNITQEDTVIKLSGAASFGVRIDGTNNTYNMLDSDILLEGANSIGLGVTDGKGNTVNVDEDSSISVTGDNDVAVSFDFGKNVQSEVLGIKGSYVNYDSENNVKPTPENQGALVSEFNLDGKISATGNNSTAIYISDNAHVEDININDGAEITGNIVSAWNSVRSGSYGSVQYETQDGAWEEQDPQTPDNWHYTNLNIKGDFDYAGNILGDSKYEYKNKTYTGNTLKLNIDSGKSLDISGDDAAYQVYTIANKGTINLQEKKNLALSVMNGKITETGGIIKLGNEANLYLHSNVKNIENTVDLGSDALLSTINEDVSDLAIKELIVSDKPTNKSKVSFDLGDTFSIENNVDDDAEIKNIYVNKDYAESLENGKTYKLFTNKEIDLGESSTNFYYGGKKYNLAQKSDDKSSIITSDVSEAGITYDLSDAIRDNSTINYVVADGEKQSKTAGEIKSEEFEISGADLNFNGHDGLIINGDINKKGIMLKTSAYGAPTNLTVKGAGRLVVYSSDKAIGLGYENEIALDIKDGSTVLLNSANENQINVFGDIKGNNKDTDKLITNGYAVNIYNIDPITVYANAEYTGLYGISDNVDWNLTNGTLYVEKDENLSQKGNNSIIFNGGALNLQNNQASQINLANMTLGTTSPVSIDVDFNTMKADRFAIKNTLTAYNNVLYIKSVNILNTNTPLSLDYYEIPFINSSLNNTGLLNHINLGSTVEQEILTPILKYNFGYSEQSGKGNFTLSRTQYGGYDDYNPAIAVSSVAQQGMYLTQLNTYDQAFANMDMTMLMSKDQRTAWKNANKLVSVQDANNGVVTYSPNQFPEENRGVWFRPFASFENVNLNDGPRTDNISYGGLVGGDSDLITFKAPLLGNVDMIWGAYAGYNGSHQTYQGNSIYQNGGTLGLNAAFYWKNFFTGITANVGASAGDASTMYGKEYMTMLAGGIAGKMGYNWELFKGRFIVQPSLLMSTTLVNTFDYTNAAGVRMHNCCPLIAGQLAPGLKFIGNLKNGWQPYANIQMMWNIMDKTRFKANDAHLSEMSVDPYIQYGVGLQKRWGDRFTGFGQVMMRNGGRNGISFNAGFRYELGKNGSNSAKKAAVKHYTQKNISLTAK